MALIKYRSLGDFSVAPTAKATIPSAEQIDSISVLAEVTRAAPPDSFDFLTSKDRRGLALHTLQLKSEFQSFLQRLFNMDSDIYFLAWAWDMSGLQHYPGANADPSLCLIPLKGGQLREFIGVGAVLFPPRPIRAGLALRIQIWESRQKRKEFGKLMAKIASTIKGSDLNTLLITLAAGASGATGGASGVLATVEPAALELAKLIGDILANSSDDFVDYFEGYFPASESWNASPAEYEGKGSTIVLNRLG
jgi:hypothetical protein